MWASILATFETWGLNKIWDVISKFFKNLARRNKQNTALTNNEENLQKQQSTGDIEKIAEAGEDALNNTGG